MPIRNFRYSVYDEDGLPKLREDYLDIPAETEAAFKAAWEPDAVSDSQMPVLVEHLLSHGATRCDGENGEPSSTIWQFKNFSHLDLYREGNLLADEDMPTPVLEIYAHETSKHPKIRQFDHSGNEITRAPIDYPDEALIVPFREKYTYGMTG